MARTKRSEDLSSRNKRLELALAVRHIETLAEDRYLIYRRPQGTKASGTWSVRWRDRGTGSMPQEKIGIADDFVDADGITVLTYEQATKKAGKWFKAKAQRAHLRDTGERISDAALTVRQAIEDHIATLKRLHKKTDTVETYAQSRIYPELGDIDVSKLSKKRIEEWMVDLSMSRRLKTGQRSPGRAWTQEEIDAAEPMTEDQLRARKVTTNRVLAILKRALNEAVEEHRYEGITAWRDVKPFRNVNKGRVRFLTVEEQLLLLEGCPSDFGKLVIGALHTGSRYAPLTRMQARDFHEKHRNVFISTDKGDRSRYVDLDDEAVAWFKEQVRGLKPTDLIFRRDSVKRITRKDGDPLRWMPDDQTSMLAKACRDSGVEPLVFHELRHTYASMLIEAGASLKSVAEQLGHVDTRMVDKYYGHIRPSAKKATIQKLMPKRGLKVATKQKVVKKPKATRSARPARA